MSVLVVDASVAAKWYFDEVHAADARRVLRPAHQLHAPDFFVLEMDSIVCKRVRRNEITPSQGDRIRAAVSRLPIHWRKFSLLRDPAWGIANQTGRSIYDCLYVALAMLVEGQMVTADQRLYNSMRDGPFGEYILWVEEVA